VSVTIKNCSNLLFLSLFSQVLLGVFRNQISGVDSNYKKDDEDDSHGPRYAASYYCSIYLLSLPTSGMLTPLKRTALI